jgi:hypothetical protein
VKKRVPFEWFKYILSSYNKDMMHYLIHLCIFYLVIKCIIDRKYKNDYPEHFYELGKYLYEKDKQKLQN